MSAPKKALSTATRKPQKQTWMKIEHPSYYSNIMQVGLSPFDVSIEFGTVAATTSEEITCKPHVMVTISPEQAANLMQMLGASLQGYIRQFGNLRTAVVGKPGQAIPTNEGE